MTAPREFTAAEAELMAVLHAAMPHIAHDKARAHRALLAGEPARDAECVLLVPTRHAAAGDARFLGMPLIYTDVVVAPSVAALPAGGAW